MNITFDLFTEYFIVFVFTLTNCTKMLFCRLDNGSEKVNKSIITSLGDGGAGSAPFVYSSYADHPLVLGGGYEPDDIKVYTRQKSM